MSSNSNSGDTINSTEQQLRLFEFTDSNSRMSPLPDL